MTTFAYPKAKRHAAISALVLVLVGAAAGSMSAVAHAQPTLEVAPGGRHLQTSEGKPFFYLGDTAWALFHRLTCEEAEIYLRDRADKGFTVIQAVALAELRGLDEPNAYGELPLIGHDPAQKSLSHETKPAAMLSAQPSRWSSHGGGGAPGPSQNAQVRSHEPAMPPVGLKSAAQVMKPDDTM